MRFLLGVIVGVLLTIVVAYVLDQRTADEQQKTMVNWEVVGEKIGDVTAEAREVWTDFTREITGPP